MDELQFARERFKMVAEQLKPRGIRDPRVLAAFETIPRHIFVPKEEQAWSYGDYPQPIGYSQTISQPYVVALMTESLNLTGTEKVLEVGTGSGYQAAILSMLAAEVYTVEVIPELSDRARKAIDSLEINNIHIHLGDGSMGLPAYAPFDAITVTAAAPHAPRPLLDQLSENGRMIVPVGNRVYQELELWQRIGGEFKSKIILPVAFVPLRGKHGWDAGRFE